MTKISVRLDYLFENESISNAIQMAKDAGADGVEYGQLLDFDCEKAATAAELNKIPFVACGYYDTWAAR